MILIGNTPTECSQLHQLSHGQLCFLTTDNSGLSMVQLWFNYGLTMVQLWFNYGSTMVSLWFHYGFDIAEPSTICLSYSTHHILQSSYMGLEFGGFHKWGYPQIIHFNTIFHYKPAILGYPHFWKPPFSCHIFQLPDCGSPSELGSSPGPWLPLPPCSTCMARGDPFLGQLHHFDDVHTGVFHKWS